MRTAKSGPVTGSQGNVIFCNFGAGSAAAASSDEKTLAGIRATIAEINGIVSETFTLHAEAAALERDAAQLIVKALESMDIVAFQSRILLAGADDCSDDDTEPVAASLWRFVSAGAAVSQRLHALAREHRSWIAAEERVMQNIAEQAAELETTAADCIKAMHGDLRQTDASF